jgi:hypothetical protein
MSQESFPYKPLNGETREDYVRRMWVTKPEHYIPLMSTNGPGYSDPLAIQKATDYSFGSSYDGYHYYKSKGLNPHGGRSKRRSHRKRKTYRRKSYRRSHRRK